MKYGRCVLEGDGSGLMECRGGVDRHQESDLGDRLSDEREGGFRGPEVASEE